MTPIMDHGPTAHEQNGIDWWNSLSEPQRADWLGIAGNAKPADAWIEYKRCQHIASPNERVVN